MRIANCLLVMAATLVVGCDRSTTPVEAPFVSPTLTTPSVPSIASLWIELDQSGLTIPQGETRTINVTVTSYGNLTAPLSLSGSSDANGLIIEVGEWTLGERSATVPVTVRAA